MPQQPNSLPRRSRWRLPLIILAIFGLGIAAAGAAIWWKNRPIQATILSEKEKQARTEKLAALQEEPQTPAESTYTPGEKEIVLTERELNGLIHENTSLGEQLKLEFTQNSIHARISADIPEDFPIMPGKKLKGKARFLISEQNNSPSLVLDDLTLWGISLPNDWIGGLKGQNLLSQVLAPEGGSLAGIEKISVSDGKLIIKLAD